MKKILYPLGNWFVINLFGCGLSALRAKQFKMQVASKKYKSK